MHETNALIAVTTDGVTAGLAHYRRFARPSTGTTGSYLDDLLSDPAHRGNGIGRALIEAVTQIGVRQGCSFLRWITAANNATAQQLYDTIATRTPWPTCDTQVGSRSVTGRSESGSSSEMICAAESMAGSRTTYLVIPRTSA